MFLHIGTDSTHQRACRGSVTCVTITVIISLVGSGKLHGIGIGTIIAMVVVGRIIAVFNHFTKEEITSLLECLNAAVKTYRKGEYIFQAGEVTENFGMIIEGKVQIISDDYWGERQILAGFGKGQLFGEAYACMEKMPLLVSAIAVEESQVLMLNAHRVLQTCTSACA